MILTLSFFLPAQGYFCLESVGDLDLSGSLFGSLFVTLFISSPQSPSRITSGDDVKWRPKFW